MKKWILIIIVVGAIIIFIALLTRVLSNYFGWYAYKKWEYRLRSINIAESKERSVFIKELNFKIDNFRDLPDFKIYIEKGFKFGKHSSKITDTAWLSQSNFPYQICFTQFPDTLVRVELSRIEQSKADSADTYSLYLKKPDLPDTLILKVSSHENEGVIKVWK